MKNQIINDFLNLFFPATCVACGNDLYRNEETLCTRCLSDLPFTGFQHERNNQVEKLFWGRVEVENAAAMFYFRKGNRSQKLLHQLKYKSNKELGQMLGRMWGHRLNESVFNRVDVIIPIPLHWKRERKRGYNQSAMIARGMSLAMQRPVALHAAKRVVETSTQTRKSRYERWNNVRNIFQIDNPESLQGKHVLLVDDVITTGATLEALACEVLEKCPGAKISVAALAYASL